MSLAAFDASAGAPGDTPGVAVFGYRHESCVGAIVLEGPEPDDLSAATLDELTTIANRSQPQQR